MKAGDVLHLTRAASPQFVRPIFFRLIKARADLRTYDGWTWLDGYQLDEKGDAVARRELYVLEAGVSCCNYVPLHNRQRHSGLDPSVSCSYEN